MDYCKPIEQCATSESRAKSVNCFVIDCEQVLKDATQFFSRGTPNLATVIPAMDFINDRLSTQIKDCSLSPAIKASLSLGKQTLNKYYLLTDSSEVYRIAMSMWFHLCYNTLLILPYTVLHPHHKLSYFKKAGWEQGWIDTAKDLVRDEFNKSYNEDNENELDDSTEEVCSP